MLQELITAALILAGALVMALAVRDTARVLQLLGASRHTSSWRALLGFQIGFIGGYLLVCALVLSGNVALTQPLLGAALCAAAVFVLLVARLAAATVAELQAARLDAEAAGRARSTFLANMSHELRAPLSAIIGYSDLLLKESAEQGGPAAALAPFAPDLLHIRGAGAHLLGTLDAILDHAKIEAGRIDLRPEPVELPALLEGLVDDLGPLAARNRNSLKVSLAPELPALVADTTRLRQILFNLLENACRFTDDGSVTLRVSHDGGELLFSVSDTGIGMSREQLAHIFQPFVQATGHTVPRYGGTGLGLTIAQQLARLMGGEIGVVSAPGRGSTFTLRLPAGPGLPAERSSGPVEGPGPSRPPHRAVEANRGGARPL